MKLRVVSTDPTPSKKVKLKIKDPETPTPQTYKTQAEVNAANLFAQQFSERRRTPQDVLSPNQFWVAKKPGDPVVQFVDQSGKPYVAPKRKLSFQVPEGIRYKDLGMDKGEVWYNDPQTGDLVYVDPSILNLPRFKNDADKINADKVAMFKQKIK